MQNTVRLRVCLVIALLLAPQASAQPAEPLPDAADVVKAFRLVRGWIDSFQTPGFEEADSQFEIANASAVFVQLRRNGRIVAQGSAGPGEEPLVRRAAGRALGDFLANPALNNLPDDLRAAVGREVTLELEVAGPMAPIVGRTFVDAASRIEPGLDGIALRRGSRWVVRFPAHMRMIEARPATYVPTLLNAIEVERRNRDLERLRTEEGLSIYRFATTHLVERAPRTSPIVTYRGHAVIQDSAVDPDSLRAAGAALFEHIKTHRWSRAEVRSPAEQGRDFELEPIIEPLGLFGDYHPARDVYEPLIASPEDQALVAYALAYYASTPGIDPDRAGQAVGLASDLLRELADRQEPDAARGQIGEQDPLGSLTSCAMIVLAADELATIRPAPAAADTLIDSARQRIRTAFDASAGTFALQLNEANRLAPLLGVEKAKVALALVRLNSAGDPAVSDAMTRSALDVAWAGVDDRVHLTLMPWIGWAELEFGRRGGPTEAGLLLDRVRRLMDLSQRGVSSDGPPDLVGGYALAGPFGTETTAQGLRPAAWRARELVSGDVQAGDDMAVQLGRMLRFGRFLMQLVVTPDSGWAYANPRRATGGVRESLWDASQPLPAQALALVTFSDILRGIDRFEQGRPR